MNACAVPSDAAFTLNFTFAVSVVGGFDDWLGSSRFQAPVAAQ